MGGLQSILPGIRGRAGLSDRTGEWPVEDLAELAAIGAMRWAVPADAGGADVPAVELHLHYESIATASLATALVLSQRDSGVGLIDGAVNDELRAKLLAKLNDNRTFTTVGIAQLTTSRQGSVPALLATPVGNLFRINGTIPWATGADRADYLIVASAVAGGGQILFALPREAPGVTIATPMPLVALAGSRTTSVHCENVMLDRALVLSGPTECVLSGRRKALTIGQSFLAMGFCRGAIDLIGEHRSSRAQSIRDEFTGQLNALRAQVLAFSMSDSPDPNDAPKLRGACNDLAVRVTHAAVALYKGTALMMNHPAQRLAREAMFLLVWSCPDPVIDCTVELLANASEIG